jgi:hypothetical protein
MKPYPPQENLELYNWKEKIVSNLNELKAGKENSNAVKTREAIKSAREILNKTINAKDDIKGFAFKWMEKLSYFNYLPHSIPLESLLKAVNSNDGLSARMIVKEAQKKSPLHPELPTFKLPNGETIIHLAARKDKDKVISELSKINPLWTRHKDHEGNTPLHIASKYLSINTVLTLGKRFPSLIKLRNSQGLTPTDFEGGTLLIKHVSQSEIAMAVEKEAATIKKAKEKLKISLKNAKESLSTKPAKQKNKINQTTKTHSQFGV